MKRSRSIRLILLGTITTTVVSGCSPQVEPPPVTTSNVYTNNHFVPGVGYYHAPFAAWYERPYNFYDGQRNEYYYGGQWNSAPHQSIVNVSPPTPSAVDTVESKRTDITRGGFGRTSSHHWSWS